MKLTGTYFLDHVSSIPSGMSDVVWVDETLTGDYLRLTQVKVLHQARLEVFLKSGKGVRGKKTQSAVRMEAFIETNPSLDDTRASATKRNPS